MKKQSFVRLMIALLVCGGTSFSFAAESTTAAKAPASSTMAKAPAVMTTEGSISALDLKASTLKLETASGKSANVSIKDASVWKNGKQGALADLKVGEKVKVRHTAKGGQEVAKSIEIL